jgi:hypothetical protein
LRLRSWSLRVRAQFPLLALVGLALGAAGMAATAAAPGRVQDPALDFRLHCMGCHGADGRGVPQRGIPDLRVEFARFLQVPGGRAYLAQVPGVLQSALDDAAIARLLNWVAASFAAADADHGFEAYTAQEVARYRRAAPANVMLERARLSAPGPASAAAPTRATTSAGAGPEAQ